MKRFASPLLLVASLLLPGQAFAADCALPYEIFEAGVPHTDMEDCPETLAGDGLFCRLSLVAEVATIFVFSEETDCLLTARAFEEGEFAFQVN